MRLYLDETGDHTGCDVETGDVGKRYLGLVGVWFEPEPYRDFCAGLEDLKRKHLPYDPDEPPVLHREDIIFSRGPFYVLQDAGKRQGFNTDVLELIKVSDFRIVGVVIDKHTQKTYRRLTHPYHYCLLAMLERYCGWMSLKGLRGDVMAEARGSAENRAFQEAYHRVFTYGTRYHGYDLFGRTLTSKATSDNPRWIA